MCPRHATFAAKSAKKSLYLREWTRVQSSAVAAWKGPSTSLSGHNKWGHTAQSVPSDDEIYVTCIPADPRRQGKHNASLTGALSELIS